MKTVWMFVTQRTYWIVWPALGIAWLHALWR